MVAPAGAAEAAPVQVDPPTTATVTTTEDLLVGETTESTPAPAPTTTTVAGRVQNAADDDARTVWYIVAGLIAVALALVVLTALYWRRTRPRSAREPDPGDDR